jgi:hypothetical protein
MTIKQPKVIMRTFIFSVLEDLVDRDPILLDRCNQDFEPLFWDTIRYFKNTPFVKDGTIGFTIQEDDYGVLFQKFSLAILYYFHGPNFIP